VSYRLITQLQKEAVTVSRACRALDVSRSGYYAASRRTDIAVKVCAQSVEVKAAFEQSGNTYGSRRVAATLHERGLRIGRYRVRSLMRAQGLRTVWKRKFVHTTDSNHTLPISPNVLARRFDPNEPNHSWVADITYVRTRSGWLYLAVVLDLFARKVVGWAMAPHMQASLVCQALQQAITQRSPLPGLIVHTDRGSQYASAEHQALLAKHGCVGSMSGKANCWDNAVMERFFLNLKMERVWQSDYANHAEAKKDIADYIVGFYNPVRLHSKLGNLPPNVFEQKAATKRSIAVSEIT
jgi:putative transposase